MQPEKRTIPRWQRILGRLHRIAEHLVLEERMQRRHESSGDYSPRYRDPRHLPPGIDIGPGMDTAPTDPEVYRARRPTPPPEHLYELPQADIPPTITPTSDLIREILDEIDQDEGSDVAGSSEPPHQHQHPPNTANSEDNQPPSYENATSSNPGPSTSGYVMMAPRQQLVASVGGTPRPRHPLPGERPTPESQTSSMIPPTPTSRPPTPEDPRFEEPPAQEYDELPAPRPRYHREQAFQPIPQGSPPLHRPREVYVPHYYREYLHCNALPAYYLICHSAWYVQIDNSLILCRDCATSEHVFCATNRPRTVWRHLHLLSRNLMHTTLHCGRCYNLLLRTRRAIDCYTCRIYVINHYHSIERVSYKLICDTTVPYNI